MSRGPRRASMAMGPGRPMAMYDLDSRPGGPLGLQRGAARGPFEERERKEKREQEEREAREAEEAQSPSAAMARHLLLSIQFDLAIGVVISLNAVSIGVEQTLQINGHSTTPVQVVENIFLVIYIGELALRLYVHGFSCFKDNWVKFDAVLVVMGILNSWIIEPFVKETPDGLGLIMVLRVARLLRLAKMARFFSQIQEFWRLIRGLFGSLSIMSYTFILLFIILYVFSSLGFELITKHDLNLGSEPDPGFQDHVRRYFSSLPQIMFTLIQFVTLDDMHLVYQPLVEKDATLAIYFILLILVMSIVVANLVAAVIFSGCLEQNVYENDELQRQQEDQWAELIRDLKDMFHRLDVDNTGQLSRDNMINISPEDQEQLAAALGVGSPMQIFGALDVDHNGAISINEFFDGIWDVMLTKGDVELKRMEKQVESIHWRVKEAFSLQHEARLTTNRILKQLEMDTLSDMSMPPWMQAFEATNNQPSWATELNDSMKGLLKALKVAMPKQEKSESAHSADKAQPKKQAQLAVDERGSKKGRDTRDVPNGHKVDSSKQTNTPRSSLPKDASGGLGKASPPNTLASMVRDASVRENAEPAHERQRSGDSAKSAKTSSSKVTSSMESAELPRGSGDLNGIDQRVHRI